MMHIPIDDQYALHAEFLLRITSGDGDIVEQTETHWCRVKCVMTGRPHERECRAVFARHAFERRERAARGMQRTVIRRRIDIGVARRECRAGARRETFAFALHEIDVCRRMRAFEFGARGRPRPRGICRVA